MRRPGGEQSRPQAPERNSLTFLSGLAGIGLLLLIVLALEGLASALGFRLPSAVFAMGLLAVFFWWHQGIPHFIDVGASYLFRLFPLLFVPPLVGVIKHSERIADNWLALLLVVSVSTLTGLIAAAYAYRLLKGRGRAP